MTHLNHIDDAAQSSAGPIRVLGKDAVTALWKHVERLLRSYADGWKVDDIAARIGKMQALLPRCPTGSWLAQALSEDALFITKERLLQDWPDFAG